MSQPFKEIESGTRNLHVELLEDVLVRYHFSKCLGGVHPKVIELSGINYRNSGEVMFHPGTQILTEARNLDAVLKGKKLDWRDDFYTFVKGFIFMNEKYTTRRTDIGTYGCFGLLHSHDIASQLNWKPNKPTISSEFVKAGWFPGCPNPNTPKNTKFGCSPYNYYEWEFEDGKTLSQKFPLAYGKQKS
jgi:hypothetical protein